MCCVVPCLTYRKSYGNVIMERGKRIYLMSKYGIHTKTYSNENDTPIKYKQKIFPRNQAKAGFYNTLTKERGLLECLRFLNEMQRTA